MQYFFTNSELPSVAPRIVKVDVGRLHITGYDIDNGYPQRMITYFNGCPTLKRAAKMYADYVSGQGFDKDGLAWNYIFNNKGQMGDDLIELIAKDYSRFENFAIHVNYNALFNGVEANVIPIETVRRGIGEQAGKWAICADWWNNDRFGQRIKEDNIDYIDNFDHEKVKDNVRNAGGWKNYNGQVYVFNPEYTLATCDSVLDDAEAEILSKKTLKSNVKNNFGDKTIWMQPEGDRAAIRAQRAQAIEANRNGGNFEVPYMPDGDEIAEGLQNAVGPDGDQLIYVEFKSDNDKPVIETIENKLDDKKFAFTLENARQSIYGAFMQPAILHSDLTQGRYNQNQLPEAMKYYNNTTEQHRIKIQRGCKKVLSIMPGLENEDFAITPLNDLTSALQNNEGASNGNSNSTEITD
jgi:hypothetical protein